jgi:hypothetical protein
MVHGCMGGHLKISKYGCLPGVKRQKYKKKHVRKLAKSFHITNCITNLDILKANIKN